MVFLVFSDISCLCLELRKRETFQPVKMSFLNIKHMQIMQKN